MAKKGEKRGSTGKFSTKTPGLPNTDAKRADSKLRDFNNPTACICGSLFDAECPIHGKSQP